MSISLKASPATICLNDPNRGQEIHCTRTPHLWAYLIGNVDGMSYMTLWPVMMVKGERARIGKRHRAVNPRLRL